MIASRLQDRTAVLVLTALGWLALAFLALPLLIIIAISFTTTSFLSFPPTGFTLKWYAQFLADVSYLESLWLSAWLALASTAIALVLGVSAAVILVEWDHPAKRAVESLFLSPLILPTIVIGVSLMQLSSVLGMGRSYVVLLAGHVVIVIPYIIRTTIASLSGFDKSIQEAARDLGATSFQAFYLIVLPIIKPGVIAGSIFALIISWINVELSIFNTVGSAIPIPVKLFNYIQYSVDPLIAAVSATTIYVAIAMVVIIDMVVGIDRAAASGR